MVGGETKRKIWEAEENKVEKETKYKQKKIYISPFFLKILIMFFFSFYNFYN